MALASPRSRLLDIRLFGEPCFYAGGQPQRVSVPPKALLLLCVLALKADQPVDRTKLAFTLWPDDAEDEAKTKLRRHLHLLGRALEGSESQLAATNNTITWKSDGPFTIDVVEFEKLSRSQTDTERAAALYGGELLHNFYEDWLDAPRKRLRELQLQNLLRLADRSAQNGESAQALEHARAALRIDPWREDAFRHVLRARSRLGDRSGAMQEYAQFASRLYDEFGAEPVTETKRLYESIKIAEPACTNLPLEATRFIGREAQLITLKTLLRRSRLVTIAGPGGVGKSRIALHCARELQNEFPDGIWLLEAGPQSDEEHLLHAIAGVCGMPGPVTSAAALAQALRARRMLLFFDNVESFLEVCAHVCTALLAACEQITILTSSREPLGIAGEMVLRLAPFEADEEAVSLFCDRALAADASFDGTAHSGTAIAEICRRVDRLPLAIELAAARVAALTPEEILARLDDRFSLLKRARTPAVRHHQTLHATIAWSCDLLSATERRLLRRLAILRAPFTIEAIETICCDEQLPKDGVFDTLTRLIDKSLVHPLLAAGRRRYRLLDSVRDFAFGELRVSPDAEGVRERCLRYYESLTDRGCTALSGAHQGEELALLQEELDNLRVALHLGQTNPAYASQALRIATNLKQFWLIRGYFSEGRRWLERTLEQSGPEILPPLQAEALSAAAMLASLSNDHAAAESLEAKALALRTQAGDEPGIARSVHSLGYYAFELADFEHARELFSDALSRARNTGDEELAAKALDNLGLCATATGDFERARHWLDEALKTYQAREDTYGTAWVLAHLAWLAERTCDYRKALDFHGRALALRERLDDPHGIAGSSLAMARCYEAVGDRASAQRARRRSITTYRELHNMIWLSEAFENFGCAEALHGDPHKAAVLLGAAEHLRAASSKSLPTYERCDRDAATARIEAALGRDASMAAMQSGGSMLLDDAVAFALGL